MPLFSRKTLKRQARSAAQGGLAKLAPAVWRHAGERLLILAYHRVLPNGDPETQTEQAGMWVTPDTLRAHIQVLREHFEIVDLARWLSGEVRHDAPCCALTFDDGWADNYHHGFPVLKEEEAPATVFLVSDYVASGRDFWPGRLTRLVLEADRAGAALAQEPALAFLHRVATGTLGTSQPELDRLVMDAKALGDVELHEEVSHAAEVLGVEVEPRSPVILDWEQVEKMGASGWIRFGSHGRSHQRLCSPLDHDTQRLEVESSRAALREKVTAYSDVFCYPNGDSSPEAEEEVRRSYVGACVGAKGWNQRGDDPFRLRRILIHQDVTSNEDAFLARLSGVL